VVFFLGFREHCRGGRNDFYVVWTHIGEYLRSYSSEKVQIVCARRVMGC
jgi:hypothetical protein